MRRLILLCVLGLLIAWLLFQGANPRWDKNEVSYSFINCPATLDCEIAQQTVRLAFKEWDNVSGIRLSEVPSDGDILVSWGQADRLGLGYDGRGGRLANAVPPFSHGLFPMDGDIVFDDAEGWSVFSGNYPRQINLQVIALHETGHALGVMHLWQRGTIMNHEYSTRTLPKLTPADIAAIQAIYGPGND